jgi:hypothetical protein
MDFYEYMPGGKRHERCQGHLAEFRRGMAEAIGTFALVLVSCLASASPYSSDISTLASSCSTFCDPTTTTTPPTVARGQLPN